MAMTAALRPAYAAAAPLDIEEYVVDGNSVLSEDDVDGAVYPYLGPGRRADDIEAARAALQQVYKVKGYLTVRVAIANPEPDDGVVHLKVTEVKIGRLRVVGSRYYALAEIKREAPSLREGSVPNFNALRRDQVILNALIPDRTVTPTIKAGHRPGTVDADLLVKDQPPFHASLEINNQHSVSTSPLRAIGSASYDNLWQLGHRISLSFQTAPESPKDAKVFSASYLARFLGTPYSLTLTGIRSNSNVAAIADTNVIGNGTIIGLRGTVDLPGSERITQNAQLEVDYKNFTNNTLTTGGDVSASLVPATYYPLTASYTIAVNEATASDLATVALTMAPPRAGSSGPVIDSNRYDARGQDLYLRPTLDRSQELPAGFSAHARLAAQVTDQPLISNEQFPLGGVQSVRGYYESEKLVDTGVSGTIELNSPSLSDLWHALSRDGVDSLQVMAFVDGARGFLFKALPEQQSVFALASTGLGMNARLLNRVNTAVFWARPLLATANTPAGSQLVLFTVSTEY